jgi:hypothetical protein
MTIPLPADFDQSLVRLPHGIVEIWRGKEAGGLRFEQAYFVKKCERTSMNGNRSVTISGPSIQELLGGRIVAYKSGSTQTSMDDYADDMMKEVIRDNLGGDASAGRDLTAVGGGVTIQKDLSKGPMVHKSFAWKKVPQVLKEIADTARQQGKRVYYDLVPVVNDNGILAFEFRTYTGQLGADRSSNSNKPLIFSEKSGALVNVKYVEDYTEEANYIYVGGQGEGEAREVIEKDDEIRMGTSIWNRRELFRDARHISTTAQLENDGYEVLNQYKPKFNFSVEIGETESLQYGRDWNFGDLIMVDAFGMQFDTLIDSVKVTVDGEGNEIIKGTVQII